MGWLAIEYFKSQILGFTRLLNIIDHILVTHNLTYFTGRGILRGPQFFTCYLMASVPAVVDWKANKGRPQKKR